LKEFNSNILAIKLIASGLDDLLKNVVFVGGAVAELYADNQADSDIRVTLDVDCFIELSSRRNYNKLEEALRLKGFKHDISNGAPICRWNYKNVLVDIMPSDEEILGFSNAWYKIGISSKIPYVLDDGVEIAILTPAIYLATKIEALNNRGSKDLRQSSDFEDIIYVLENCSVLLISVDDSDQVVQEFLRKESSKLLARKGILEAIECVLPYGSSSDSVENVYNLFWLLSDNSAL
jgi:predicted nucleotidyltransferase